jgi:ssDNA-binding Zn-finger/Zn-ribbon topoisomerase 1
MRRRVSNKNKLHRRLADSDKLRIHRVFHADTRCVICATAIVDPHDRRTHLKENPSLKERMDDPEQTNGTPMSRQFWLQEGTTGKIIGPCGEACGGRAVVASWSKEKRDEMRLKLLAAGVPKDEIEDRLEQAAQSEWREMLRIYRRAERDAQKLKIDITTLTYDEIVAAIEWEKRWRNFEYAYKHAESLGLKVKFATNIKQEKPPKGGSEYLAVEVEGVVCLHPQDIHVVITEWRKVKEESARQAALAAQTQKRSQYPQHVEFLEWALASTSQGNAVHLSYSARKGLEDALFYIERGNPYPSTLVKVEQCAVQARSWNFPWTGAWPGQQPVVAPSGSVPVCPLCGAALVHKQGHTKYGRPYDFYGCSQYPRCKGTMETTEFNRRMGTLGGQQPQPVAPSAPPVVAGSKAMAAALALAQANPALVTVTPPPPPEPESVTKHVKARKSRAFWNR